VYSVAPDSSPLCGLAGDLICHGGSAESGYNGGTVPRFHP
jgi:hypothetical protein